MARITSKMSWLSQSSSPSFLCHSNNCYELLYETPGTILWLKCRSGLLLLPSLRVWLISPSQPLLNRHGHFTKYFPPRIASQRISGYYMTTTQDSIHPFDGKAKLHENRFSIRAWQLRGSGSEYHPAIRKLRAAYQWRGNNHTTSNPRNSPDGHLRYLKPMRCKRIGTLALSCLLRTCCQRAAEHTEKGIAGNHASLCCFGTMEKHPTRSCE